MKLLWRIDWYLVFAAYRQTFPSLLIAFITSFIHKVTLLNWTSDFFYVSVILIQLLNYWVDLHSLSAGKTKLFSQCCVWICEHNLHLTVDDGSHALPPAIPASPSLSSSVVQTDVVSVVDGSICWFVSEVQLIWTVHVTKFCLHWKETCLELFITSFNQQSLFICWVKCCSSSHCRHFEMNILNTTK